MKYNRNHQKKDDTRINYQIRAREVRLIDAEGEMQGVMHPKEAQRHADEAGLDLVEISPNAIPPVCKVMDYGKFKYEQKKKENDAKKKQVIVHVKEVKIRPNIEKHDYDVKMRNARKFLAAGDKVKVSLRFKGREITHKEVGFALMNRVKEEFGEEVKIELQPKSEGRQLIMILAPAGS